MPLSNRRDYTLFPLKRTFSIFSIITENPQSFDWG
nr:MAG TPA: hypothetical protein [Caudoviricetes sp.]